MSAEDLNQGEGTNTSPPAPTDNIPELEAAVQLWISQGRSEEQIHGVKNFLTGAGGKAITSLIRRETAKAREDEVSTAIDDYEQTHPSNVHPYFLKLLKRRSTLRSETKEEPHE